MVAHAARRRGDSDRRRATSPSRSARWLAIGALALLMLPGCASDGDEDEPAPPFKPPAEGWTIRFDGRPWQVSSQVRAGRLVTETFLLPGQTDETWNERIVISVLFGAQRSTDLPQLLDGTEKILGRECNGFEFETLYVKPRDAMYSWRRPKCAEEKDRQTDIVRVALGRAGLHTITYSAKTFTMKPGLKKRWTELLQAAELGRRPERGPADTN